MGEEKCRPLFEKKPFFTLKLWQVCEIFLFAFTFSKKETYQETFYQRDDCWNVIQTEKYSFHNEKQKFVRISHAFFE